MRARIQVLFARFGPEFIGCTWVGLALLVLNFLGHSWHFHGDTLYDSFLRVYGWPTVWAWRLEFYDFGSSRPSDVEPLRDVNLQASMIDTVASLVLLAGTYYTVRTLRSRARRFQFSLRALLTFTFVIAGVCGFLVADHRAPGDLGFAPEWYVPATALPLYLSLPIISGIASVLWAAGAIVCRSRR